MGRITFEKSKEALGEAVNTGVMFVAWPDSTNVVVIFHAKQS